MAVCLAQAVGHTRKQIPPPCRTSFWSQICKTTYGRRQKCSMFEKFRLGARIYRGLALEVVRFAFRSALPSGGKRSAGGPRIRPGDRASYTVTLSHIEKTYALD